MITPAEDGPVPKRCPDCTRKHVNDKATVRRRDAAARRQVEGRWSICQEDGCGARFRCAARGPIPRWCPTCKPRHLNDYKADKIAPVREAVRCADCDVIVPLKRKGYSLRRCKPCAKKRQYAQSHQWWVERPELLRVHRRERGRRRRADRRAAPRELFADLEIYERDGWICQIGNHPVDPAVRHPDPACATIDHILPQSYRGWSHTRTNVRLACLDCNNRRQNKVSDAELDYLGLRREDLRLIRPQRRRRSARTGRFVTVSTNETEAMVFEVPDGP
ncbi:HNH endonuclease [Longispora sp. NPDC051575]|uniref:HNH endonuclease n=1 Tax=Longispora sp. NPDC051575 TaxID=3154943 RepID=UPI003434648F